MRRINLFALIYIVLVVLSLNAPRGLAGNDGSVKKGNVVFGYAGNTNHRDYWFTVVYKERFWRVDSNGNIYELLQDGDFQVRPVLTGFRVDEENGRVDGPLELLPRQIPDEIFEINISERYITLQNGAIVKFVDVSELRACFEAVELAQEYLLPKVIYFFSRGKLYKIG